MRDHCGIVGAYVHDKSKVLQYLYEGLRALQHRGQESVGVSVCERGIATRKSQGLVSESPIFSKNLEGVCGIGHSRYSTTGKTGLDNAQPVEMASKTGVIYAFAMNGNIANYLELREKVESEYKFSTTTDTEFLGYLLGKNLGVKAVTEFYGEVASQVKGAYSAVMLVEAEPPRIIAVRDPLGFRPLCLGKNEEGYFVASESVAFAECYMNARFERDVAPGEVIVIDEDGFHSYTVFNLKRHAHCMFEWVYFARPDSILDSVPVFTVRERLGGYLAEAYHPASDIVMPIPDSGRSASVGYSVKARVPLKEGLQKDRYFDRRTFIMPEQFEREWAASKKLNPIPSVVGGKRVVLIDDSIVRGTNMRKYIQSLRKAGAKEVHVGISCPPLIDWCPYGIDFYEGELIARKYMGKPHEEVCRLIGEELGADSLHYNTLPSLIESIGLPREELCLACLTAEYPHEITVRTKEEKKR